MAAAPSGGGVDESISQGRAGGDAAPLRHVLSIGNHGYF